VSPDDGPLLLDGPMGTALEALGLSLPAPLWTAAGVIDRPDSVREVHAGYAAVGASVHTAASFRTTARSLAGSAHAERWVELTTRAVRLCREGAGPGDRVAGCMAPLEDCYRPDLTPDDASLAGEHGAMARVLADAGADLLLVESMCSTRELAAATRAAAATGLPVWSCVTLGPKGRFFDRGQLLDVAAVAQDAGASAFGLNCTPPQLMTPLMDELACAARRPPQLLAYGNAIFAGSEHLSPEDYLGHARRWRAAGTDIIGSCCGTTPAHLAALSALE